MAIPLIGWTSFALGVLAYSTSAPSYGRLLMYSILFSVAADLAFIWELRRRKRQVGAIVGLMLATLVILGSVSRLLFSRRLLEYFIQ